MGESDDADTEDGCVEKRRSLVEVRGSDDRDRGSFRNGSEVLTSFVPSLICMAMGSIHRQARDWSGKLRLG